MPRDVSQHTDRVYMSEIQSELGKSRSTIISWERTERLPAKLAFQFDSNNWRYWTREQLEFARTWVSDPSRQRFTPHAFRTTAA